MKITAIILKDIKSFISKLRQNVLALLIFPLAIGMLYGVLYENLINPKVNLKPISIYLVDEDNAAYGKAVEQLLSQKELNFIQVIPCKPSEIQEHLSGDTKGMGLIIPQGFTTAVSQSQSSSLKLINQGPPTMEKKAVLNLLGQFIHHLNFTSSIVDEIKQKFIDDASIDKQVQLFMQANKELNSRSFVSLRTVDAAPKPSARSIMLTSIFSVISLFIAMTLSSGFLLEREGNVLKRVAASDTSRSTVFLGSLLSTFIISLFLVNAYYFIAYFVLLKLKLHIFDLLMTTFLHSFFITSLYLLVIGLFRRERTVKTLLTSIIFTLAFFGGSFFPIENIENAVRIARLTPNYNLQKIYESILLGKPFHEFAPMIWALFGISLLFAAVGYLKFSIREE